MAKKEKKVETKKAEAKTQEKAAADQPEFAIQRIYTKDVSFETPNSPTIFRDEWKPAVNLDINTKTEKLQDDTFEVVLGVTTTVKIGEKTAFLAEVQQAGIFTIKQFPDDQLHHMLGSFCPNILYPYAREAVTDLVGRGGFPQLYLSPVNFEAVYQQQLQQQAEEAKKH